MQVLKDDIKRRILDVARQEFNSQGFAKASMRDIASKVGVGVGNLYNYYPGKDDLFPCRACAGCFSLLCNV